MDQEQSVRYYGWIIVGLSFVLMMAAYCLLYCYSVFIPPLVRDLGLSRAEVSAPFSICVVVYSTMSLISGRLTDRFGPRPVIMAAGLLMAAGFVVLSRAQASVELYVGYSVLYGLGMSGAYIPMSATLVRWFVAKRGTALALSNLGGSAAMAIGPFLGVILIEAFGWRDGFIAIGALCGGLVSLSAIGFRRDPGDAPDSPSIAALNREPSFTLPEARRTPAFWIMCGIYLFAWSVMFFPLAHFGGIALDRGWGPEGGVQIFAIAACGGVCGRLVIGSVSDRIGRKAGLVLLLAIQIASCLLFAWSAAPILVYAAAILFGIGSGASVALYPAVVGDTFGRKHVGAIAGFAFAFTCSGGALGPMVGGWIHDQTGSYDQAFLLGAIVTCLAMVCAIVLKRPARH